MSAKTVRINLTNETASGRREGWSKLVTAVDTTKTNGYAFEGEFLGNGEHDLPIRSIVIQKNPVGSLKNGGHQAECFLVCESGELFKTGTFDWKTGFLTFRDHVAAYFVTTQQASDPQEVDPTTINWQEAREAMITAGYHPLIVLGNCEHWINNKGAHCVLQADGEFPHKINLGAARNVRFIRHGRKLVAEWHTS